MDYQTTRFYWNTAELALKAGVELDRSRRDRSAAVEIAVERLLKSLQEAVDMSGQTAPSEFRAAYELYRQVIAPGSTENLRITADLVEAVTSFCDRWRSQLEGRDDDALYEMMCTSLDIHQFCLSRIMGMQSQETPGFAA